MQSILKKFLRALAFSAATLCMGTVVGLPIAAQQTAASPAISGIAVDPQGSPVQGASVVVRNQATGRVRSATTDASGHFSVSGLGTGKYTVILNATGFATINKSGVEASTTPADIKLEFKIDRYTDEVIVNTDGVNSVAARLAPLTTSLDTRSAKTDITSNFITNFTAPTSDFSEFLQMVPGAFSVNPNGVGQGDSKTSFRGLTDGSYTVTFDGIPWNDTNSATHHSWAFFPSQWIGGVTFDRSPGDASDIGPANFGGTIKLLSHDTPRTQDYRFQTSYGSFNTLLLDAQFDTGEFGSKKRPVSITGDVHRMTSDGFQTYNNQQRYAGSVKASWLLSPKTILTGFSGVLRLDANTPDTKTSTRGQIAQSGYSFLMSNNPYSSLYKNYSGYDVPTDFEYLALNTETNSGWRFSDKGYTYSYNNRETFTTPTLYTAATAAVANLAPLPIPAVVGAENYGASAFALTAAQATIGSSQCKVSTITTTPSGTGGTLKCTNPIAVPTASSSTAAILAYYSPVTSLASGSVLAVPSRDKDNSYRTEGNILAVSKEYKWGTIHTGAWTELASTDRFQIAAVRFVPTPGSKTGVNILNSVEAGGLPRFHEDFWTTSFEPYFELLTHPIKNLTLVTGIKMAWYNQLLKQQNDTGSGVGNLPANFKFVEHDASYTDWLPSVNGNYRILPFWSVYGQFGTGDVIPPSSVFDVTGGNTTILPKPTYARTYQGGTVVKLNRFSGDADFFYIHFDNAYSSVNTGAPLYDTTYYANPASVTKGFEAEGTLRLYGPLSLYGNLTVGNAYYQGLNAVNYPTLKFGTYDKQWVSGTPDQTEALALTYQGHSLDVGMTAKRIGTQRVDLGSTHNATTVDPFFLGNFYANYTIRSKSSIFNQSKIRFTINNITNLHAIVGDSPTGLSGNNAAGTALAPDGGDALSLTPGRSYMGTFIIGFAPHHKK